MNNMKEKWMKEKMKLGVKADRKEKLVKNTGVKFANVVEGNDLKINFHFSFPSFHFISFASTSD